MSQPEPIKTVDEMIRWLPDGTGESKPIVSASFAQTLQDRVQELESLNGHIIQHNKELLDLRDSLRQQLEANESIKRSAQEINTRFREALNLGNESNATALLVTGKMSKQILELSLSESMLRKALEEMPHWCSCPAVLSGKGCQCPKKLLSTPPSEAFRPWVEFVRDCRDNFDCDSDAHKYNTHCRTCSARQLLDTVNIK